MIKKLKCGVLYITRQLGRPEISPRTGSETNTTICVIYILDIDSHWP